MIARIRGTVIDKGPGSLVVEVAGVGYELLVSAVDQESSQTGQEAEFHTYDYIRENTHDLYGFVSLSTKQLFETLISVSGVGPKNALAILSLGSEDEVHGAIIKGNVAYVTGAVGVGKRLAERIVVDLKDKLGPPGAIDMSSADASAAAAGDEAQQALVALGYSLTQAQQALMKVPDDLSSEARIKEALKVMNQ